MTAVVEQIAVGFEARLAAIAGITGLTVARNRTAPLGKWPNLVLEDGPLEANHETLRATRYTKTFTVQGQVSSTDDAGLGPALNALYAAVVAAVTSDPTIGGLAIDTREGATDIDLDREEGASPLAQFRTTWSVDFMTREGRPDIHFP